MKETIWLTGSEQYIYRNVYHIDDIDRDYIIFLGKLIEVKRHGDIYSTVDSY